MDKCLNCQKELLHVEGRKKKKYCDEKCKQEYWRKTNGKREPKYVQYKTFRELQDRMSGIASESTQKDTKIQSANTSMPEGLNWKEQLEWKRNHKK